MSNQSFLVSVVVVCFNNLDISRKCLISLFRQDYQPMEVIVVDNGSQDDIRGMVCKEFPNAKIICLRDNIGFAGGYNAGMSIAKGKYIAIINNDAVASPQWLSSMVFVAEQDEQIGSVASIILDGNRPGILDSVGVGMALDGMSRQIMRGKNLTFFPKKKEVLISSGCACLLRMDALRIVGFFDEDFFAYCEDSDLCLRLCWAGFKTVIASDAIVIHYYSRTIGAFSLQKVFWVERNHLWVIMKNFPIILILLVPFFTFWRYLIQIYNVVTRSGELSGFFDNVGFMRVVTTILSAYIFAFSRFPQMFRKRIRFLPYRKLTSFQMIKLLWAHKMPMVEIFT